MVNTLRVAIDVASRFRQVALEDGNGQLCEKFQVEPGPRIFEQFFSPVQRKY